jgi:phage terminase large subunit
MIAHEPSLLFGPLKKSIRVLCAREIQNSIEESVHHLLVEQIDLLGLTHYFDVKDRVITHKLNGSVFIFSGIAKNVTKIKSMEGIDICWVEEAEKISKNSWMVLKPTIRAEGSEIWITFNPDQEEDPTWVDFVVAYMKGMLKDAWVKLINWRDNPWFPDRLRKEKEHDYRVDPETAAHIWEGALNTRSEAVIFRGKYKSEVLHPHKNNVWDDDYNWSGPYYGADWGFSNDPNTLVKCWVSPKKVEGIDTPERLLYVEYESYEIGTKLDDIHKHWAEDVPGVGEEEIRADCSRPETIDHVSSHSGWNIKPCEKWPESVEDGITWLRSFDWIVFHPRCEHGLIEARTYKYKVDKLTGRVLRDIVDANNHIWDAIRYAFDEAIRNSNTIYDSL